MSSSKDPYREFMRSTLDPKALPGAKEAPAAPGHVVRHQLVENVAGSVYVFGDAPANALATILAADAASTRERRVSKRRSPPADV